MEEISGSCSKVGLHVIEAAECAQQGTRLHDCEQVARSENCRLCLLDGKNARLMTIPSR